MSVTKDNIKYTTIDWTKKDAHQDRPEYEVRNSKGHNVYRGITYVFFGPPIRALVPHIQVLNEFQIEGTYFTGRYFIRVEEDPDDEDSMISKLVCPDLEGFKSVKYCMKFSPSISQRGVKYFGGHFCQRLEFAMLSTRLDITDLPEGSAPNFSWLDEIAPVQNSDDAEFYTITSNKYKSNITTVNLSEFFDNLDAAINEDTPAILRVIVSNEMSKHYTDQVVKNLGRQGGKGKGKGWELPKGISKDDIVANTIYPIIGSEVRTPNRETKGPLTDLMKEPFVLIQNSEIFQWKDNKLNRFNSEDMTKDDMQNFRRLLTVVSYKISNKLETIKQLKADLDKLSDSGNSEDSLHLQTKDKSKPKKKTKKSSIGKQAKNNRSKRDEEDDSSNDSDTVHKKKSGKKSKSDSEDSSSNMTKFRRGRNNDKTSKKDRKGKHDGTDDSESDDSRRRGPSNDKKKEKKLKKTKGEKIKEEIEETNNSESEGSENRKPKKNRKPKREDRSETDDSASDSDKKKKDNERKKKEKKERQKDRTKSRRDKNHDDDESR